jgi:hypothetical protein
MKSKSLDHDNTEEYILKLERKFNQLKLYVIRQA